MCASGLKKATLGKGWIFFLGTEIFPLYCISRRLQLQFILPAEHQRLVKYPLLLENLAKQTEAAANEDGRQEDEASLEEVKVIRRCVDRTREILESIDRRVHEAQNIQKLVEIQRNLDTSGLEKLPDSQICQEYRVSRRDKMYVRGSICTLSWKKSPFLPLPPWVISLLHTRPPTHEFAKFCLQGHIRSQIEVEKLSIGMPGLARPSPSLWVSYDSFVCEPVE